MTQTQQLGPTGGARAKAKGFTRVKGSTGDTVKGVFAHWGSKWGRGGLRTGGESDRGHTKGRREGFGKSTLAQKSGGNSQGREEKKRTE